MDKGTIAIIISVLGFSVSLGSLALSFVNFRRDREKLVARSRFFPSFFDEDYQKNIIRRISVTAVNAGRRPIILTAIGFAYDDKRDRRFYLNHPSGVTLTEKQSYTIDSEDMAGYVIDNMTGSGAEDMWFEDTLGNRHHVKGAKLHLKMYFKNEVVEISKFKAEQRKARAFLRFLRAAWARISLRA